MQYRDKGSEQQSAFSNPVCKATYNSLPKIYGRYPKRQSNPPTVIIPRVNHHYNCTQTQNRPSQKNLQKKRKFTEKSVVELSLPKKVKCDRKSCECYLKGGHHEQKNQRRKLILNRKKAARLAPINRYVLEEKQSSHKVIKRNLNSPSGISVLLLQKWNEVQKHKEHTEESQNEEQFRKSRARRLKIKKEKEQKMQRNEDQTEKSRFQKDKSQQQVDSEFESNQKGRSFKYGRSHTQQINTYKLKDLNYDKFNEQQLDINVNVETEEKEEREEREKREDREEKNQDSMEYHLDEFSNIKPETKEIQIQVNLSQQMLLEGTQQDEHLEQQQIQEKPAQNEKQTLEDKNRETPSDKMKNFHRKKFYTQNEQQGEDKAKSRNKSRNEVNRENHLEQSGVSSSEISYSSIIKNALRNNTKFEQLNKLSKSRDRSSSKSSSLQNHFSIPKRQDYSSYLKNYNPLDEKSFKLKRLVKKPLFTIVQEDDGVFFGQVKDEKKNGSGLHVTKKLIFEGQYEENQIVKGCQRNIDGVYKGYFVNGKRQGYGTFQWNNGEKFEGNWKKGVKSGFGIWRSPKGDYYEGQWKNNRQEGEGLFRHKLSTYRGQFVNFMKHGKGEEIFSNGDRYIGQYKEGKPDGEGKYIWADESYYQGQFDGGTRNGYGKWVEQDGTVYEGQFKDDCKDGEGKETNNEGYFVGIFSEGEKVKGKYYDEDGNFLRDLVE